MNNDIAQFPLSVYSTSLVKTRVLVQYALYKKLASTAAIGVFVPVRRSCNLLKYSSSEKFHTFVKFRPHTGTENEMKTAD